MTTVDDMSTTRKAPHHKGSRPQNQENVHNHDERTSSSRHDSERATRGMRVRFVDQLQDSPVYHPGTAEGSPRQPQSFRVAMNRSRSYRL
jgi:hypothetical protein